MLFQTLHILIATDALRHMPDLVEQKELNRQTNQRAQFRWVQRRLDSLQIGNECLQHADHVSCADCQNTGLWVQIARSARGEGFEVDVRDVPERSNEAAFEPRGESLKRLPMIDYALAEALGRSAKRSFQSLGI